MNNNNEIDSSCEEFRYSVLSESDFAIWVWNPITGEFGFNARFIEMLGYKHNSFEFHISAFKNILHPEDKSDVVRKLNNIGKKTDSRNNFSINFRLLCADGEYTWVRCLGYVISRDLNGVSAKVCGLIVDLHTIDGVTAYNDRMRIAINATNDGIFDWNVRDDEVYYSPEYIKMLGYTPEEYKGDFDSWYDRIHPDDRDDVVTYQFKYINNAEHGDVFKSIYRLKNKNDEYIWILGRARVVNRDENDKAIRIVGLHTDITNIQKSQDELTQVLYKDGLTSLYNRLYFDVVIENLHEKDFPLSVFFCDLTGLKLINDHLGHQKGDELISIGAKILTEALPSKAQIFRIGGDEFIALLPNTEEIEASEIKKQIDSLITNHNNLANDVPLFMAIGMINSKEYQTGRELLAQSDYAMRKAKSTNRKTALFTIKNYIEMQTDQYVSLIDRRTHNLRPNIDRRRTRRDEITGKLRFNDTTGFSPSLKAELAIDVISGDKTLNEVNLQYGVRSEDVNGWIAIIKANAEKLFDCAE